MFREVSGSPKQPKTETLLANSEGQGHYGGQFFTFAFFGRSAGTWPSLLSWLMAAPLTGGPTYKHCVAGRRNGLLPPLASFEGPGRLPRDPPSCFIGQNEVHMLTLSQSLARTAGPPRVALANQDLPLRHTGAW